MKIKKIELHNYKQFKDLTLDLTYPDGHKKEGQPLDKICIIGQSGTGKTNLLETIKKRMNTPDAYLEFIMEKDTQNENIYFRGVEKYYQRFVEMSSSDKKLIDSLQDTKTDLILKDMGIKEKNLNLANNLTLTERILESRENEHKIQNNLKDIDLAIEKIEKKYNPTQESENFVVLNENAWHLLRERINSYQEMEKPSYKR